MSIPRRPTLIVIAVSAAMLHGCDQPASEVSESLPAGEVPVATEPIVTEPVATGAVRQVSVGLREWDVVADTTEVPAGEVVFRVHNAGTINHALEVERGAQEWETAPITPNGEATLTVVLEPGEYELYCPLEDQSGDHEDRGMKTVLRVR